MYESINNIINEKSHSYYRTDAGHPSATCMNKVCTVMNIKSVEGGPTIRVNTGLLSA